MAPCGTGCPGPFPRFPTGPALSHVRLCSAYGGSLKIAAAPPQKNGSGEAVEKGLGVPAPGSCSAGGILCSGGSLRRPVHSFGGLNELRAEGNGVR